MLESAVIYENSKPNYGLFYCSIIWLVLRRWDVSRVISAVVFFRSKDFADIRKLPGNTPETARAAKASPLYQAIRTWICKRVGSARRT